MDLVYLFDSKNVSAYAGFDVSSCLLFHVCLLISRIGTLSTLFHGQDISFCYTISENWCSFSRLEYFGFLCKRQKRKVFSLAFCTHACLLISRTGILAIFFTLRMFRSVAAYARFFFVSFCLSFPRLSTFYAD